MDDYTLPLSSAEVLQPGKDITLLSWGAPLYSCVEAINMLRSPPTGIQEHVPKDARQAQVELIDLRTILPWDRESGYFFRSYGSVYVFTKLTAYTTALSAVAKSVAKTGRCVIVHEAPVTAGAGAEIAAHLQKSCFLNLEAPVARVGGLDTPFPHGRWICTSE